MERFRAGLWAKTGCASGLRISPSAPDLGKWARCSRRAIRTPGAKRLKLRTKVASMRSSRIRMMAWTKAPPDVSVNSETDVAEPLPFSETNQ